MKRIMMICAAALGILVAAVSCCKDKNKVTAIVAGPEQAVVALDIAYDAPICPNSICPEAFEVEGREVVCVKACKEGHVFVLLKPECKKACEQKCEEKSEKACCDKECCGEAKPCKVGGECCDKPECCKAGGKPCCKEGKPECEKACEKACDQPKPECGQKAECGDKPACKEGKPECGDKPACEKACEQKCEKKCDKIAVPKICVKQVADIKDVEGNVVPAWKKAIKASDAKPACKKPCDKQKHECAEGIAECGQKAKCDQKPECGQKAECGDKPACEKKAECGEGKPECEKPCEKACEKKCEK